MPFLHHYDAETLLYLLTDPEPPQLSPLDAKQGREVYLVPANATIVALPEYNTETQQVRFNTTTQQWDIEDIPIPTPNFIEITTSTRLFAEKFLEEISIACPGIQVTLPEDIETANEKVLRFDDVEDTQENRTILNNVISSHTYSAHKLAWIRIERTNRITTTEWIRARYEDELKLITAGVLTATTLTEQQFITWLTYWQTLRDFPSTCDPLNLIWPTEPET